MKLILDNNDGLGPQDYTAYVDAEHLPKVVRKLNKPAQMTAWLVAADPAFRVPASGARVLLQRGDGTNLFTGYLVGAPEQLYLGRAGLCPAWRYVVSAEDDTWLLDRVALPLRAPMTYRTAGDALRTLANDVAPGAFDLSGVQDLGQVRQFAVDPQKSWSEHAAQVASMSRAGVRAHDARLELQPLGSRAFTISEDDAGFCPEGLSVVATDKLRNDAVMMGELEPQRYVRDYFLGDGATLAYYLSQQPFSRKAVTVFQEDYAGPGLSPTLWEANDPGSKLAVGGGALAISGGPVTLSFVEQLELAGGLVLQHGDVSLTGASSGILGGIYSGTIVAGNCVAGFQIAPSGSNCTIQALVNGAPTGVVLTTNPAHRYAFMTQLICNEAQRVHQQYCSSVHPAANARGGDTIAASVRVVLSVHDVDPGNPGTWATPATVLFDGVLASAPAFVTYALLSGSSFSATLAFTRVQKVVDAEIRSMAPNSAFRTRTTGQLADGGECYVTSAGQLRFYPPYPPQSNEQLVVSYRTSGRAVARVQNPASISAHAKGSDNGHRSLVRKLKAPLAPSALDCENAALALLDDSVLQAWSGEYRVMSDFLAVADVLPGDVVQVAAPSRGAAFSAIVRETDVQIVALACDRSQYAIRFSNDAATPLALEFTNMTEPLPLPLVVTANSPSSSMYIAPLVGAQVTGVTSTTIGVDTGCAAPAGGGFEVRNSDGGWGPGSDGNLVGRYSTQAFTLPRISRVQSCYLRQYDGSNPAKYSRQTVVLHVDYPL